MSNQVGDLVAGGTEKLRLAFGIVNETWLSQRWVKEVWGHLIGVAISILNILQIPLRIPLGCLMKQTQGGNGDQTGWKFRQMVFAAIE